MKSTHQPSLIFVIIVVVTDTTGFGLIFPVLPKLLTQLLQADISTAARYGGWLAFAYASMQFVFAPVLGNLSDRFGRRPVLLSSLFGLSIDYIFLAFAPSITWLFIGRIISGITGASYSVASACIADISTEENRTKNFGLLNAAFGLGFILGPVVGGTLSAFGTHMPFIVAAVMGLVNFVFGWFFFPESLATGNRRAFDWKRANPLGSIRHFTRFPALRSLVLAMVFVSLANHSMESVWAYFTIEKFNWSNQMIGYSLAFIGLVSIFIQVWLVGFLAKSMGDTRMAIFGLLLMSSGFFLFAFTPWEWLLLVALLCYLVGSVQGTAMQSMMSAAVPDNEQGEFQGSIGSLMGLTTLIAPPLMTISFSYFTMDKSAWFYFPGVSFLIAGVLTVFSLLLLIKNDQMNT